ncbi:multicopper oxidase domain-containing protein [Lentzea sp. NPDC004782]|uniref:multicopper oxidase domain-containing protein n=1 Tax=Lentzea sp. NPDC004782 TaxID=3154458 RepID=UPI0033A97B87
MIGATSGFTAFEPLNDDGGNNFYINGKLYDMTPTFTEPAVLGTVEEWTLTNTSGRNHPFHLHTAPFQVLSVNGAAQPRSDHMDGVTVPYAVNGVAGKVVIRMRFTDFTGPWMFHCHIAGHEDNGMMGPCPLLPLVAPAEQRGQDLAVGVG